MSLSTYIKRKMNLYKPGITYIVPLKDIIISEDFNNAPPKKRKMNLKLDYYRRNKKFQSPIVLDKDFVLKNGYTSYLIGKMLYLDKVEVMFE